MGREGIRVTRTGWKRYYTSEINAGNKEGDITN